MPIDAISKILNKNKPEDTDQVIHIPLDALRANPFQPRSQFDSIQMEELSRSIKEIGVIQPIVVRQSGELYEIVSGERRWRASRMSGLATIPAIVRQFNDKEMAEIALVENLQRADLNYFEIAEGYRRLIEDFHLTQEEVAVRVGKSQPTIANKLRVLKIDPVVKENIMVELVTERHVRALLRLKTSDDQLIILKEIYEKELNVKDTEDLITDYINGKNVFTDENAADEGDKEQPEKRRQTIRRSLSDVRIYINTIKAAVATILESGIDAKMNQVETDDAIQLTITIPRVKS